MALSNTGNARDSYYDAPALHGAISGLSAGVHAAEVQYKAQGGDAYIPYHGSADGNGYLSLTAEAVPNVQLATSARYVTASASGTSTSWAAMPGAAMSLSFQVGTSGESVLLFADLSRVQHAQSQRNTFFRILVDGATEAALTNTGGSISWS